RARIPTLRSRQRRPSRSPRRRAPDDEAAPVGVWRCAHRGVVLVGFRPRVRPHVYPEPLARSAARGNSTGGLIMSGETKIVLTLLVVLALGVGLIAYGLGLTTKLASLGVGITV